MSSPTPTLVVGVQALRAGTNQKVAYTGTAGVITNAVKASIVRVTVTSAAYIAFGTAPTATADSTYVAADQPEYFRVVPDEKVSAVRVSGDGVLFVTEMD